MQLNAGSRPLVKLPNVGATGADENACGATWNDELLLKVADKGLRGCVNRDEAW